MSNDKIRVRYAPSPTGELHIGNARTALFNYLFARHYDGDFIIRIEDTDLKRNIAHGEQSQLDNLKWLGIDWDESPDKPGEVGSYRQSERLDIYQPLVKQLLKEGKAYKAYETAEELEEEAKAQRARGEAPRYSGAHANLTKEEQEAFEREGRVPAIRFRVPEGAVYEWDDMVKGPMHFEAENVTGDWVIQKKDGYPTYNFAVVVDDYLMKISHVLRGDDHIANTPRQLMIYEAFGWQAPTFGHMTLIVNQQGRKLSKRDGGILQFIEQYRNLGYLPEAMFNFMSLLGWSPGGEEEIFNQEELIKLFTEKRLSTSPASFDAKKLEWINNEYVKAAPLERIVDLSLPHLIEAGHVNENPSEKEMDWVTKLVSLYHNEMSYGAEIVPLSKMFFEDTIHLDDKCKEELDSDSAREVVRLIEEKFSALSEEDFVADNIRVIFKELQKEADVKGRQLFMPIRIAVSGQMRGPELPLVIELFGKERVLDHIEQVKTQL